MAAQLVSVLPLNVRVIAKTISACWFVHSLRMKQSEASRKKTAEEEEKHSTQQQQQKPYSNKWPTVHRSRATMFCLRLSKSTERPRRIRLLPLWLACCCFAGNFQYQTARYTSLNHMPPFYIHQKVFKHPNARSVYIKGWAHVFRNLHINDHQVKSLFYATHMHTPEYVYTFQFDSPTRTPTHTDTVACNAQCEHPCMRSKCTHVYQVQETESPIARVWWFCFHVHAIVCERVKEKEIPC